MYYQPMWLTIQSFMLLNQVCVAFGKGLWKERLQFSHKMLVLMQQLLGENLYSVSHRKQDKIMMTVAFEHQNLGSADSQVTFLYWKSQIKVVYLMGTWVLCILDMQFECYQSSIGKCWPTLTALILTRCIESP